MTAGCAVRPAETSVPPEPPAPDAQQPGPAQPDWPPRLSPRMLVSMLPSVLANIAAPAVAYSLVRPQVSTSAGALLAAMAIPVAWTLGTFAWRRRADRLGLASVAVSLVALGVSYFAGHSTLTLELQDPAETGALALACLVSVIMRRPLWLMVLRLLARGNAQAARLLAGPSARHNATVETLIIGAMFGVHAVAITILALTVPTGTFVALSRPVGLPSLGIGLVVLIGYRRSRRRKGTGNDQPS